MDKKKFVEEVAKELAHIKKKATKQEIDNLVFAQFNHASALRCIYGLMTGYCLSERAKELYHKSYDVAGNSCGIYRIKYDKLDMTPGKYFTSLEKYLYSCTKKNHRKIFQYLKGKLDNTDFLFENIDRL